MMQGDPLIRAHHDIGPTGLLAIGGAWHLEKQHAYAHPSTSQTGEEGLYGWVMKSYQDWRIIWLGHDETATTRERQSPI